MVTGEDYDSVKEIKSRMIDSYGEAYKWLTNEWIGRQRRQDFKQKRRLGPGVEYMLNPAMVVLAAKRMNIDIEETIDMEIWV